MGENLRYAYLAILSMDKTDRLSRNNCCYGLVDGREALGMLRSKAVRLQLKVCNTVLWYCTPRRATTGLIYSVHVKGDADAAGQQNPFSATM